MLARLAERFRSDPHRLILPEFAPEEEIALTCDTSSATRRLESARALLSCILAQAIHDAMTQVEFSIDEETWAAAMRYWGPADAESPEWWEMTAPPATEYPYLFQAIITSTRLEPGIPMRGSITARLRGKDFDISVEFESLARIRVQWPDEVVQRT